jgi:predicted sugar kinase
LINLLNQDLIAIKADLSERDAQEAAEFMQQVENEVQAKKPDGSYITRKLKSIAEIATAAGATAAAANQLGPHVQQAIQIVQSLFGG